MVKNDSKVGIGNIVPQKKLTIGSSQGEGIQFTYDGTNNYRSQILTYWTSNTDSRMDFNIARSSGVTPATIMSVGYGENVGIGTTTPSEKLEVDGGIKISNGNSRLYFGTEGGTSYRALEGSTNGSLLQVGENYTDIALQGNVGIGTTSPDALLEINAPSSGHNSSSRVATITAPIYPSLEFYSTNTNTNNRNWKISSVYNAYGTLEFLQSSAANGVPNQTVMAMDKVGNVGIGTTDNGGRLTIQTADATTNSAVNSLMIRNLSSGTTTTGFGGEIRFQAQRNNGVNQNTGGIRSIAEVNSGSNISSGMAFDTSTAGVNSEALRITYDGNVGIGVIDPDYPLEVSHNTNTKGIKITGGGAAANSSLVISNGATSGVAWDISSTGGGHGYGNGDLNFGIGFGVPKMQIKNSGNVGIGNFGSGTAPQSLLHVQGTNNSAGDLYTAVGVGNCPGISIGNTGTTDNNNAALYFRNDGGERASVGARFVNHSNEKTELRFSTTNGSGATRERVRITGDGAVVNTVNSINHFKFSKAFTCTGNSVTKHEINLINELGAGTAAQLRYEVSIVGYGSGGVNGVIAKYSVGGYSGHSYSATNYGSFGAGTIQNGYKSSNSTSYNAQGLSYHPAVNMGSFIANGEVWAYSPGPQRYGFTVSNNSASFGAIITIEGVYS
jgi:hypothetical protein